MTAPTLIGADIQLVESTHIYTVDGIVRPSVTQVLEDVGIINYGFLSEADRAYYMLRGCAAHLATELDDRGELIESSVDPAVRGFLESWRNFRRDSGFEPELIEQLVWNPQYRYTGRFDCTGRFAGRPSLYLLDKKTGTAPYWCRYQTAAYTGCLKSPRSIPRLSLELHEDATYRVAEERAAKDWAPDFQVFTSSLEVYNAKRRK